MVAVVVVSCGRDERSGSSRSAEQAGGTAVTRVPAATAVATTAAPATQPPSDEEEVLAAVDGYWRTWEEANNPPNPDHPGLAKYATGPALAQARAVLADFQARGLVARRPVNSQTRWSPKVLSINENWAEVENCSVDDVQQLVASTGEVVNGAVVTHLFLHRLVLEDGSWRVAETKELQKWEGVVGCADSLP